TLNDNIVSASNGVGAGGGITNLVGAATVANCTFNNNHANDFQGQGGAIYNYIPNSGSANLTVTSCTFSADTAKTGSEIYNEAGSSGTATATIRSSLFKVITGGSSL